MSEGFIVQSGQGEPITIGPASMSIKSESDRLFVAEHFMPPNFAGPPPHVHDEMDHAFYVLEGSVRFLMAGKESIAGPGSFVYVPNAVVHSFGNPSESQTRFLEINVPGGFHRYYRELAVA